MESTVGKILAYLKTERTTNKKNIFKSISEKEKNCLQSLRQQFGKINSQNIASELFQQIPEHECQTEQAFLENNKTFFLCLILIDPKDDDFDKCCTRLSSHLNNCFRCFEIFSQVMVDFYYESQKIHKEIN
jgi:hypothetical protein